MDSEESGEILYRSHFASLLSSKIQSVQKGIVVFFSLSMFLLLEKNKMKLNQKNAMADHGE
jgi:hypothetical protein